VKRAARTPRLTLRKPRRLAIEPLEERRVLDAVPQADFPGTDEHPWHNSVYRLDVNNDGTTGARDLLTIINKILRDGVGPLPVPPPAPITAFYDTSGDNALTPTDLIRVINGLLAPPEVTLSTSTLFTVDVTPHVTVQVTQKGSAQIPDGTPVLVDVDINSDGDFTDPGELAHSSATLFQGQANFELETPLARRAEVYNVRMRARVQNSDAVPGFSTPYSLIVDTLTSDALENYVHAPDASYEYELAANPASGTSVTPFRKYTLSMTSQTWRSTGDVNLPVWHHWLELYVPFGLDAQVADLNPSALLFVRGGSNTSGVPSGVDNTMAFIATSTQSVVAVLRIVPNEPVTFSDETVSREEDEIIAYTFDKFLENIGQPGNDTWPLLLPMTKSAVRAMDTIQSFVPLLDPEQSINDFVVSGESKRGWTTWLTAAADDRVRAIIPGVYDNLNVGEQMVNHFASLGEFSEAIRDYNDMQIFQRILTPEALELSRIIDPYRYLDNGRFDDMPKLLLNSAGDEFFLTDSSRFYFNDLPGTQNYLRYLPNTGHGLDESAVTSRATFYDAVINNRPLPEFSWTVAQDGTITVQAETAPTTVKLWQKYNPASRDMRDTWTFFIPWEASGLIEQSPGVYAANVETPDNGARAYFIELTFPNSVPGAPDYIFTTEARVKSKQPYFEWPFESGFPDFGPTEEPLAKSAAAGRAAVAAALAIESDEVEPAGQIAVSLSTSVPVLPTCAESEAVTAMLLESPEQQLVAAPEPLEASLIDKILSDPLADLP